MKVDLEGLSKKELTDLKKRVDQAITDFDKRKKQEAIAALEAKAKSLGFDLNELVGEAGKRKRKPAKAKYVNPANKSETWTGRGRKPRWAEAALKSGKSLEDLLI